MEFKGIVKHLVFERGKVMIETKEKPHLSVSQINRLASCGIQYKFMYVDKIRMLSSFNLLVGKTVDKTVNINLTNKIETGELLSVEEVKSIAKQSFLIGYEKSEIALTDEEQKEGIDKVRGKNLDKAVTLAALHAAEVAPKISPKSVQEKRVIE